VYFEQMGRRAISSIAAGPVQQGGIGKGDRREGYIPESLGWRKRRKLHARAVDHNGPDGRAFSIHPAGQWTER